MKKIIYTLIIGITMFIGISGVEAETLFKCKYKINFSQLLEPAENIDINFEVVIGDSKKTTSISSFEKIYEEELLGGYYITKSSGLEKNLYELATANNTCPDITFYIANTSAIQMTTGNYAPDYVPLITVKGEFTEGNVQEGKEIIICSREKKIKTENYKSKFIFYTVNGEKYWKLSNTSGVKATDVLSMGSHVFHMSSDLINKIYSSEKECESSEMYLKCALGAVENIELTDVKPDDVENCSYGVKESKNDDGSDATDNSNDNSNDKVEITPEENYTKSCFVCGNTYFPTAIATLVRNLYNLVKLLVPVIIIITGMVDLLKSVMASDEKKMEDAKPKLIKKLIAGITIFLIFAIVQFVFKNILGHNGALSNSLFDCVTYFISEEPEGYVCPTREDNINEWINEHTNNSTMSVKCEESCKNVVLGHDYCISSCYSRLSCEESCKNIVLGHDYCISSCYNTSNSGTTGTT